MFLRKTIKITIALVMNLINVIIPIRQVGAESGLNIHYYETSVEKTDTMVTYVYDKKKKRGDSKKDGAAKIVHAYKSIGKPMETGEGGALTTVTMETHISFWGKMIRSVSESFSDDELITLSKYVGRHLMRMDFKNDTTEFRPEPHYFN